MHSSSEYDNYQFGFKHGHSTGLCTHVLKETIDYYRNYGSHVFTCFVDFSKAFDKVNYWKLFKKLLNDNVNAKIIHILAFWYSKQECFVRWRNSVSSCFRLGNGTRQGSVLSPYLFSRYIRDMIKSIADTGIGCAINNKLINILAYADDIVLIAPSWRALQILINVLQLNAKEINMTFNTDKTVAMIFAPKDRHWVVKTEFPQFKIDNSYINYVPQFKYLGHIISNNGSDNQDIQREIRNMFIRTNVLRRKFASCSFNVKKILFKSYCMCFFDIALWSSFTIALITKLHSCYNKCVKLFFGYKRFSSLTATLLETGLPSFDTVLLNSRAKFKICLDKNTNLLVKCFPV